MIKSGLSQKKRPPLVWECKIGVLQKNKTKIPYGSDLPIRIAVEKTFQDLTNRDDFECFSG